MPGSFICHHVHIGFGTKNRVRTIPEDIQPKLWAYMAGIAKNYGMHAVAIGGMDDHVHLLIECVGNCESRAGHQGKFFAVDE